MLTAVSGGHLCSAVSACLAVPVPPLRPRHGAGRGLIPTILAMVDATQAQATASKYGVSVWAGGNGAVFFFWFFE